MTKDQRTCPACIGTNGNHERGCYLAPPSSKQKLTELAESFERLWPAGDWAPTICRDAIKELAALEQDVADQKAKQAALLSEIEQLQRASVLERMRQDETQPAASNERIIKRYSVTIDNHSGAWRSGVDECSSGPWVKYDDVKHLLPDETAAPINQCDGCRRGVPVNERGLHVGPGGFWSGDVQGCTAHLYLPEEPRETSAPTRPGEVEQLRRIDKAARAYVDGRESKSGEAFNALQEALFNGLPEEPSGVRFCEVCHSDPCICAGYELPEPLRDPVRNLERGRALLAAMPCWCPYCKQPHGVNQTPVTDAALAAEKASECPEPGQSLYTVSCARCNRTVALTGSGGGRVSLSEGAGWYFSTETGWLCPADAPK